MRVSSITGLALSATTASAQLNQLAKAAGKSYFGTGTDNGELYDSAYVKITSSTENFGQLTPANGQKWDATEANQGSFSFANGDVVPNFAKKNGQVVRCHTLLYRSQLPSWVTSGTWTAETLTSMLETHISNVAGHYKGQCYSWDVVNEAIDDDGEYRDTVFFQALGADYTPLAFKAAAAADPDAKVNFKDSFQMITMLLVTKAMTGKKILIPNILVQISCTTTTITSRPPTPSRRRPSSSSSW